MERGNREIPARFLDFVPVGTELPPVIKLDVPSQGAIMTDFSTWMQNNWYEFCTIIAEFTFVIAGLWFARKILKTLRASQEQFGALLKLTLTDELVERAKLSAQAHRPAPGVEADRPTPYVMAEWPTHAEAPALSMPEPKPRRNLLIVAWRGIIRWLQTPMNPNGLHPWRRVARWLQAPVRS